MPCEATFNINVLNPAFIVSNSSARLFKRGMTPVVCPSVREQFQKEELDGTGTGAVLSVAGSDLAVLRELFVFSLLCRLYLNRY